VHGAEAHVIFELRFAHFFLASVSGWFDIKYWPSLADVGVALSTDEDQATSEASAQMTMVGTGARRASQVDYFKALFRAFEDNTVGLHGFLPASFSLSDAAYAVIASCGCGLDLVDDDMIEADNVKRLRHRERENSTR